MKAKKKVNATPNIQKGRKLGNITTLRNQTKSSYFKTEGVVKTEPKVEYPNKRKNK